MHRIEVAEVVTPTHRYNKAKVTIDEETSTIVVTDRRGQDLLTATGELVPDGRGNWTLTDSAGVLYQVRMLSGCGCGGTTVDEL